MCIRDREELVSEETFPAMKCWMQVRMVNTLAPYLSNDFRVESGAFNRALSGVSEAVSREESAYNMAVSMFGEVVGIYYGKTYFGEEARRDVQAMVERFVEVYNQLLSSNEWLSDETQMCIRDSPGRSSHSPCRQPGFPGT